MVRSHKLTAGALAVLMGASISIMPTAAQASEDGRKNTALALGAAAAALLLTQRDKTPGILAGVGAAIAFSQANSSRDRRWDHDWDRYRDGQEGYDRDHHGWDRDDRRYDRRYDDRRFRDNDRDYRNEGRVDRYDRGWSEHNRGR